VLYIHLSSDNFFFFTFLLSLQDYEHIGYNLNGERIGRSKHKDGLESAIADHDDPQSKRTVYDALNDREVVLSERDIEIIRRIQSGAYAHPEHDAHPDYIPYYTADEHVLPLSDVIVIHFDIYHFNIHTCIPFFFSTTQQQQQKNNKKKE
jgi:hypothetical protein